MDSEPYLIRLANRLTDGLSRIDPNRRERHRSFILAQQNADGGFSGREGDSDLYYSSFAARGLAALGGLSSEHCEGLADYLKTLDYQRLSIIDLVSWLNTVLVVQLAGGEDVLQNAVSNWPDLIAEHLESVRTTDGGYAKNSEGAAGSTYHSFLVALTYELVGRSVPNHNALVQFLYDRQRDDGGFVEIAPMKRGGTNPTAAAVALLNKFDAMDPELIEDVGEFLLQVRSSEGGFQANTRIPFADGLSTFTGLLTLQDLKLEGILETQKAERYALECLEFPTGGFRGASWDEQADVEYTFYGLGILALLNASP